VGCRDAEAGSLVPDDRFLFKPVVIREVETWLDRLTLNRGQYAGGTPIQSLSHGRRRWAFAWLRRSGAIGPHEVICVKEYGWLERPDQRETTCAGLSWKEAASSSE